MIPLFKHYPPLSKALPFVTLGQYPTPVLDACALDVGNRTAGITVKQDGLSGLPYGGNKVRKLEFLLGDALAKDKTDIFTFGGAGSNHALATAIYAQQLGLRPRSFLIAQPNSHSVRNNLLRSLETGVQLRHFESTAGLAAGVALEASWHLFRGKGWPYLIPPGGTSALGLLGYVNAAFELKAQVDAGDLPLPDVIYVASGTMGTCVGLALGFQILGLNPKICSVAVTDAGFSSINRAKKLFDGANALLRKADSAIPEFHFGDCDFELRHDFFGGEYGRYTKEGADAVERMKVATGTGIEGCYTGKCLAALLEDLHLGRLADQQVLFWNTYNATTFAGSIASQDYRRLPRDFHRYFDNDVQELDRGR